MHNHTVFNFLNLAKPKYLSLVDLLNIVTVYTTILMVVRMNGIQLYTSSWMNPTSITEKVTDTQKMYNMVYYIQNSKTGKANSWWFKSKYYLKVLSPWEKDMDFSFGIFVLHIPLHLLKENLLHCTHDLEYYISIKYFLIKYQALLNKP